MIVQNLIINIDMKIIAYIVYGVSQALYKLFGVNTPSRKAWLKKEAKYIQDSLDLQHQIKDYVNEMTDGVYLTKDALNIATENNWDCFGN